MNKLQELEALNQKALSCHCCDLRKQRNKLVFGVGNFDAEVMLVGEGPGREENAAGLPFVGRAGKCLDKFLDNAGLKRTDIYIANICKCQPPNNRTPEWHEMVACSKFLDEQIDIIQPKVIVALGSTATKKFLNDKDIKITRIRGNWYEYRGIKLMPTFHPAYILRQSSKENIDKVKEDFAKVVAYLKDQ